jgi:hypothetical protein
MKPFKGVIREWYRDGDVICGICEYHPDAEVLTARAVIGDGIVQGYPMHTSRVIGVEQRGSFAICETKNSFYVLILPRMTEAELLAGLQHLVPQPV